MLSIGSMRLLCSLMLLLTVSNSVSAAEIEVSVLPKQLRIGGANRQQQLQVTATIDGRAVDVTHACQMQIEGTQTATIRNSVLRGVADGKTTLVVQYGGTTKRLPIVVDGFNRFPPIHFENDIIPLLSKLGCNSGGCHGKQSGQNGFKLSVFGFDPNADYAALSREGRGRRVFPGSPEQSLLIQKATGRVAHGGGKRMETGSLDEVILSEWIRQSMPVGSSDAATLVSIRVEPAERIMGMRQPQQSLVTAVYSDGSTRDVTAAATYTSNTEVVAQVDQSGLIQTGKIPGEAAITVNYMGQVSAVQVLVPRTEAPSQYPKIPENNVIDGFVWRKLRKLGIVPSDLVDDSTFLRRVYLDAIGRLPTPTEVVAFSTNQARDKRFRIIDTVLEDPAFADYWALKFADVLLVDQEALGERGAFEFHKWLRQQFASNRPYDEWVKELVTASGNTGKVGPANFYRALRTSEDVTKAVSQAFLGIRLDCAQCHHHPFEKWGQEDFYGLAGYFNGIQRQKLDDSRELVFHTGHNAARMPLTKEVVLTKPLGAEPDEKIKSGDPRVHLADWMTSKNNPWFSRLVANRLWKNFMGRGLVEPVDDLRTTNPATNEPLLDHLAKSVAAGFDMKSVMRSIMRSRVYQLSSKPNATNFDDEQNFSHHIEKRLASAVLLDAISDVTGSPEQFAGMPEGTRAVELWDNRMPSYFLDTFGRSARKNPCECGASNDPTMAQTLHLMNAPEIDAKISAKNGRIAKLVAKKKSRQQIVNELCLAALGRPAGPKERKVAAELFQQQSTKRATEDLLWALLNSYDFLFVR